MGRVVIVTGAGSGIGRGVATRFGAEGCHVLIADVDADGAAETAGMIAASGGSARAVEVDVSRSQDVGAMVQEAVTSWGSIDVLVNNAGIARAGSVTETSETEFDTVVAVNLKGVFLCSKHVLPTMIEAGHGAIVNVASVAALTGAAEMAAYSASKAAVLNLTGQMAVDYGPAGIRVNSVCPGTVPTPLHRVFYPEEETERWVAETAARKPLRTVGTPEDIANAVWFLASDEARFITGTNLVVDGGSMAAGGG